MKPNAIQNTQIHTYQGMAVDPFGDVGGARLVPLDNSMPGRPVILDHFAVEALIEALTEIQARGMATHLEACWAMDAADEEESRRTNDAFDSKGCIVSRPEDFRG